jgi:hypothetical protein
LCFGHREADRKDNPSQRTQFGPSFKAAHAHRLCAFKLEKD